MIEDLDGKQFWVKCYVARPVIRGYSPYIEICQVTRIENGKIYLDNSKQPIQFPDRLLILGE